MRLIYTETGEEVAKGDHCKTSRGEDVVVLYFARPHKPSSSGKVTVGFVPDDDDLLGETIGGGEAEYYVGVIGAEWIEREDRDGTWRS